MCTLLLPSLPSFSVSGVKLNTVYRFLLFHYLLLCQLHLGQWFEIPLPDDNFYTPIYPFYVSLKVIPLIFNLPQYISLLCRLISPEILGLKRFHTVNTSLLLCQSNQYSVCLNNSYCIYFLLFILITIILLSSSGFHILCSTDIQKSLPCLGFSTSTLLFIQKPKSKTSLECFQ